MKKVKWEIACDKGREVPIRYLEEHSTYPLIIKTLTTGDYAILCNGCIKIIIERKTWKDLADTLKDPKRKANHQKLLNLREECGCSIVYLIEGTFNPSTTRTINKVPYDNLEAYLDHVMIRDNCQVIQCYNSEESAKRIIRLVKHCTTIKFPDTIIGGSSSIDNNELDNNTDNTDNIVNNNNIDNEIDNKNLLYKTHKKDDKAMAESIYLGMNGVSIVTLDLIRKYSIYDLLYDKVCHVELPFLRYQSGGLLGDKRANTIIQNASSHLIHERMLCKINGVTKETAKLILNKITFKQLLSDNIDQVTNIVANIVKKTAINKKGDIKHRTIGFTVAKRITHLLRYDINN